MHYLATECLPYIINGVNKCKTFVSLLDPSKVIFFIIWEDMQTFHANKYLCWRCYVFWTKHFLTKIIEHHILVDVTMLLGSESKALFKWKCSILRVLLFFFSGEWKQLVVGSFNNSFNISIYFSFNTMHSVLSVPAYHLLCKWQVLSGCPAGATNSVL